MKFEKTLQAISVAATVVILSVNAGFADSTRLDQLFLELQDPDISDWAEVEGDIQSIWDHSGSDAMDFLLDRGMKAMLSNDFPKAVEHLSALIDHAPDFAEGWNARATAYYMMGEYGLAIDDIRMTLVLNPRHFAALSGLGLIFEETGNPEAALRAYLEAQAIHPHLSNINGSIIRLRKALEGVSL